MNICGYHTSRADIQNGIWLVLQSVSHIVFSVNRFFMHLHSTDLNTGIARNFICYNPKKLFAVLAKIKV